MLNQIQQQQSKTISYYLRHKPEELGIELDLEGWVAIKELIEKYNQLHQSKIDLRYIEEILSNSDKKRWEIDYNTSSIRALYGHSVDAVAINYIKLTEPIKLYHSTPKINLDIIKQEGLKSMSRNYVHLTPDSKLAIKTAKRISDEVVLIEVDTAKMFVLDIQIYRASDKIYLSKTIPVECLKFE